MIGLIVVSSKVGKQEEIGKKLIKKVSVLERKNKNLKLLGLINDTKLAKKFSCKVKDKVSGCIIVVATGGTEKIIRAISSRLKKPTLLWANPFNNSLPSALEAFSKLKDKFPVKILYSTINDKAFSKIESFIKVCEAIEKLKKYSIGCLGKPTKWPLTTKNKRLIKKLGPSITLLKLEELIEESKKVENKEVEKFCTLLRKKFKRREVREKDFISAVKIYLATKKLSLKHKTNVLAVKCFDLLSYGCTLCLANSLCNDEGLIVGCEADLQATLTMIIVYLLTQKPCWMANLCRIDMEKNTITLAHCTVPTGLISNLNKASLTSHMESGKYVAIRGPLQKK
ncbi:MAG: hypothetical protein QW321_02520 [Candidatus Aenigmatarchaeota archaeon]